MKYCVFTRFDFVNASNLHNGDHYIHVFNKNVVFITKKNTGTISTHNPPPLPPKEYE